MESRARKHMHTRRHTYAHAHSNGQVGDFVLKIDGIKTSSKTHSELVDLIMGPPNTTVELEVERESDGTILTLEVRRETTARRDRSMVSQIHCLYVATVALLSRLLQDNFQLRPGMLVPYLHPTRWKY